MDIIGQINTNFDLVVFIIVAFLILVFAFGMLESKDLSHAIIFLALTFTGIAIIYLLLNAEFLALIQMSVYTGGIVKVDAGDAHLIEHLLCQGQAIGAGDDL